MANMYSRGYEWQSQQRQRPNNGKERIFNELREVRAKNAQLTRVVERVERGTYPIVSHIPQLSSNSFTECSEMKSRIADLEAG